MFYWKAHKQNINTLITKDEKHITDYDKKYMKKDIWPETEKDGWLGNIKSLLLVPEGGM
jgi:hypothetical protein